MTEQRIDSGKQIAGNDLGPSRSAGERAVGGAAAAAATGALACGAVCVVPVLLPAIALTSAGTVLAWMVGAHAWASALALAAVAGMGLDRLALRADRIQTGQANTARDGVRHGHVGARARVARNRAAAHSDDFLGELNLTSYRTEPNPRYASRTDVPRPRVDVCRHSPLALSLLALHRSF